MSHTGSYCLENHILILITQKKNKRLLPPEEDVEGAMVGLDPSHFSDFFTFFSWFLFLALFKSDNKFTLELSAGGWAFALKELGG